MLSPVTPLPDVAHDAAALARPLDWVGMEGIALPIRLGDLQIPAQADVEVDLADAHARGIHMSRLYALLQPFCAQALTCHTVAGLLRECITSQAGVSTRARLRLRFDLLLQRPALVSDHAGWKSYPATLEATLDSSGLVLEIGVEVPYSSTCPASAALSRRHIAERFGEAFTDAQVPRDAVRTWLASAAGMAATPHAQRSLAQVRLRLQPDQEALPFVTLIDAVEQALATPAQTAVKREDELAFAQLNAANLMFCEDAARRVASALQSLPCMQAFEARVAHLESLHPHDAVARVTGHATR